MACTPEGQLKSKETKRLKMLAKMEKFLEYFPKYHANIAKTCEAIGLNTQTVYQWKVDFPEFKAKVQQAEKDTINYVEDKLFQLIEEKHPAAIMFYLKCKGGYVENQKLDVNAKVANAILNVDVMGSASSNSNDNNANNNIDISNLQNKIKE